MATIPAMFEAMNHVLDWLSANDYDWFERLAQRYECTRRLNRHERKS